jgi:hypothetical protein
LRGVFGSSFFSGVAAGAAFAGVACFDITDAIIATINKTPQLNQLYITKQTNRIQPRPTHDQEHENAVCS